MKIKAVFSALTVLLIVMGCSSKPKETVPEPAPAPVTAAPAPADESPKTDVQACEGKGAKDPCSYTTEKGEVKGVCIRSEDQNLQCRPKKSKKK